MSADIRKAPKLPVKQHNVYRGRVRSGCLTCRSRKVKCDEKHPTCNNCNRLKRTCVYARKKSQRTLTAAEGSRQVTSLDDPTGRSSPQDEHLSHSLPASTFGAKSPELWGTTRDDFTPRFFSKANYDPILTPDTPTTEVTASLVDALKRQHDSSLRSNVRGRNVGSPSTLISRDIRLTTTMDLLATHEAPVQSLLTFFVDMVDCPAVTPYDRVNWRRMKLEVVELGRSEPAVASAMMALSTLYKTQLYGLPCSQALSFYQLSKSEYTLLLGNTTKNFAMILVVAFLLCLFAIIHYETVSVLKDPSDEFVKCWEMWTQGRWSHSALTSRMIAWFKLFQTTTLRGGGMGLLSERLSKPLSLHKSTTSNLKACSDEVHTSEEMYEMCSTPVVEFYFQLQQISGQIAKLTHYHRSRTTGEDQDEVTHEVTQIKARLQTLWDGRSAPQRQTPEQLRSHLASTIAEPLIALIGICAAAYHAEFVEMNRLLGDPVSQPTDIKEPMRQIRDIVDGDWDPYQQDGKLRSGYLRPLFLYAIECMDYAENAWAVERLRQINDPVGRSHFFAAFAKGLCDAQLRKQRRVTSKYFSMWFFGLPPPYF